MEKSFKKILIVICLLATVCSYAITLRWNASGDSTVVGYKLKYDTNGNFTNVIDVGNVTNFTISNTNFVDGNTYYFEAVAYDNLSNESAPSNIATYTTQTSMSATSFITNGNVAMSLTFPTYTSSVPNITTTFIIMYSTNLTTWNTLYTLSPTNNGTFNYIDMDTTNYTQKFYRLLTSTTQY